MANFAPTYTARVKYKYSVGGTEHTFTQRLPRTKNITSPSDLDLGTAQELFLGFMVALSPVVRTSFTFLQVEWASVDSNVFFPGEFIGEWSSFEPGLDDSTFTSDSIPFQTTFSGKGVDGSRARASLYGLWWGNLATSTVRDFKILTTENTTLEAAINLLKGNPDTLASGGGAEVFWYNRATVGYNDHWVKAVRRLGR